MECMGKILYILVTAILLTSCAVGPKQPRVQAIDKPAKTTKSTVQANSQPRIVIQDELLNEPPENPRFVIAQPPVVDEPEHTITESIKRQLLRMGYVEAESRDDANVVVWYSYDSAQTGLRHIGQAKDAWGEQPGPADGSVSTANHKSPVDVSTIKPVSFIVQLISLEESRFPGQIIPIWQGEWTSSLPGKNMVEFANETLVQIFEQYQSEQTQEQLAAFRLAREKRVERAINTYMKMVMYRIQSNWQKPKYKVKGKTCKVKITQSAVGEIRSHKLLACDRDRRFRKSIEKAIKKSSPLPMPKQDLFDRRELILIFQG